MAAAHGQRVLATRLDGWVEQLEGVITVKLLIHELALVICGRRRHKPLPVIVLRAVAMRE